MPLFLKKGDISAMRCDAIVSADEKLPSGSAVIEKAYNSNAEYIIHVSSPKMADGSPEEKELLASCYQSALTLASEKECKAVALPLICAGAPALPEAEAVRIAKDSIEAFLEEHDMAVCLVAYRKQTRNLGEELFTELCSYIERNYSDSIAYELDSLLLSPDVGYRTDSAAAHMGIGLDDMLSSIDESFSAMLMRKISECGISNADCYNRALVAKSVFSKIKNNPEYKPTKSTVAGFVLALRLPLDEAKEMFSKAGYSLSHSSKFDIILEWFISNRIYNVYEINEVLLTYDQLLIGF